MNLAQAGVKALRSVLNEKEMDFDAIPHSELESGN